jgi:hypothetical protein
MGKRHLTLMGAAVLAVSVLGAGCSRKSDTSGEGTARISALNLAYSDTTKVTVTIESDTSGAPGTGAAIPKPILVPLGKKTTGESWSTTAQGIPSGRVKYTGNAYNASNTVIFTGSILGVITAGNTASVTLNLFQATPNTFANNAPVIDALQVGTTSATPGQVVAVNVTAHDPDAADTLTYAWTATCGTFAAASSASTTWTAPASSSAPCVLTVAATDNHGASNTATTSISVSASSKGGVAITVTPDLAPVITGINVNVTDTATPPVAAPFVTGNVANLNVIATDDGSIASYLWSANAACTGAFSNVAIANPTFTVTAAAGVSCQFTIVVTDDKGQSTTGTLTLPVVTTTGSAVAAPVIEVYSNSSDSVAPGQVISFYVVASQINHDALTFAWTGNPGSAAPINEIVSTDPNTATPSDQITYTAPTDLGAPSSPVVITVTVTDSANSLVATHVWNLSKANDPCAGNAPTTTSCDDGNACTQSDHCDGAGHCVGASPVVCTASDACHSVGTCNTATGTCSSPNAPSGTACSDGNACTQSDTCNGLGTCSGGAPVVCTATTCNVPGTCNTSTGVCSAQTPATDGAACSDNNACTTVDTCQAGACVGGSPVSCPVATDACHVAGTCVPATGTCSAQTIGNEGGACNDGNFCTSGDVCTAGVCAGPTPTTCPAGQTCSVSAQACITPPPSVCMAPSAARDWAVTTVYLASGGGATPAAYSAGTLFTSFDFGAGAQSVGGDSDVYVNALNPATGVATWSKDFGDASAQLGLGVAASSATVGVIGNYLGTMTGTTLPSNGNPVAVDFILGLNPANGAQVWGKKVDLAGGDFTSISSNANLGSFFVCGTFGIGGAAAGAAGPVDLVPGSTGFGGKDIVLAKINAADGTVAWAKNLGSTGDEVCVAITSSDDGSSVYIQGTYSNDPAFNPGTGAFPAAAASVARIFVAKFDGTTGATLAASAFGALGRQTPTSIAADSTGNVYIGGAFLTSITFATGIAITSSGSTDAYVAKLDANLVPQWAHNYGGGTGDAQPQKVQSLATDSAGHIFVGGLFSGNINVGTAGALIASAGGTDAFTMKLDTTGAETCAATYGDSASQEVDTLTVARFATGTAKDTAMFGGVFGGAMNFGPVTLNTGAPTVVHAYVTAMNANSF